ncbi:MAG: hypothetical protein ATN35_04020 [Epulopiscium sp. Nele67-Bin004]|nr:MAG: hypothetical protein ATN35_04020 [Epulopiscium sp. Nele67-Bin004]
MKRLLAVGVVGVGLCISGVIAPYTHAQDALEIEEVDTYEEFFTSYLTENISHVVDIPALLNEDLSIAKNVDGPQILIVHTYPDEIYSDGSSVVDAGETLTQLIQDTYNVQVYHYYNEGYSLGRVGAYDRSSTDIKDILQKYPTIEVVIDVQLDLAFEPNPNEFAQVSFVNGLDTYESENKGYNENVIENLALSAQLKTADNSVVGHIFVNPYTYNSDIDVKLLIANFGTDRDEIWQVENSLGIFTENLGEVLGLK